MHQLKDFFRFLFSVFSLPALSSFLSDSKEQAFMLLPLLFALCLWLDWLYRRQKRTLLSRHGERRKAKISKIRSLFLPIPFRNGGVGYMAILFARDAHQNEYHSPVLFIHIPKCSIHRQPSASEEIGALDFLLDQEISLLLHPTCSGLYDILLKPLSILL